MGEQRQFFRFRLPWLSATPGPAAPRPVAEPQPRPVAQTQAPLQPSVTIPIQRPPFRPAGIAPVQSTTPTQVQAPAPTQRTEPQPVPSRPTTQSRPPSRAPTTPAIAGSTTSQSSTRIGPQPEPKVQAVSRQQSPPRLVSQPTGQTTSQRPSPPRSTARQVQTMSSPKRSAMATQVEAVSRQQSPGRLVSQPTGQTSSQPPSPPRSARQVQTMSPPKRSAMATQVASRPPTASKDSGVALKPLDESTRLKDVAPITVAGKETPTAPPVKPKEMEERKKVAEDQTVTTKLRAAATDADAKTRELLEQVKTKTRELLEKEDIRRKKTMTASSSGEKQIKTVSSSSAYPKDHIRSSRPSKSHEKHVDSELEQVPLHKEIREDISKFVHKMVTGKPKAVSTDERSTSVDVVTLAGGNSGASFQCKVKRPDESPDEGEGSEWGSEPTDSTIDGNVAPKAYVNSNTQSINNSIVFESSLGGRNPGVHLDFFHGAETELLEPTQVKFH